MKNKITSFLMLLPFLILNQKAQAQVATSYSFTSANVLPYTLITGGHVLGGPSDDDNSYLDTLGFTFNYNGTGYTSCFVDANGYIVLGSTATLPTYFVGPALGGATPANTNCITAFCNDLQGLGLSTSAMRTQTIGTAPNRTFVVQWSEWSLYDAIVPTTEHYNFQIRLNENNGIGTVKIVYGRMISAASSSAPIGTISGTLGVQVGINGTTVSDFMVRKNTTNWDSTTAGTANTDNMTAYNGLMPDSGRTYTWTPIPLTNNTIGGGSSTVCLNMQPNALTGSIPAGGSGTYAYLWISSTTSATSGFSAASGRNDTAGYYPPVLTATTWYRRIVMSGMFTDTSAVLLSNYNSRNTFLGVTPAPGNNWNIAGNWSCGRVPVSVDSVFILASYPYMPVITTGNNHVNHLVFVGTGGTLTLNNAASYLNIYGTISGPGSIMHTNGTIAFAGGAGQTIPANTYARVEILNTSGVSLSGNISISDSLKLTAGSVQLNGFNLTMAGTNSKITDANSNNYVKTTGTAGFLNIQNIGTGGRTGAVTFPVGNSSYNPFIITNGGTSDQFSARVIDSVTLTFSGSTPTGSKVTFYAVNRAWIVNELVAGGSNATVTMQWNGTDEMAGFNRSANYIARYTGTTWSSGFPTPSSGLNPYTQSRSNVTAFSPFAVGSGTGAGTLPVQLLTFSGKKTGVAVELNWITVSELNNAYFRVERSADGKQFELCGDKIAGQGNSNKPTSYQLTDENASWFAKQKSAAILYYRLIQVDFNGTQTYSDAIKISFENKLNPLEASVEPNPFTKDLTLKIHSTEAASTSIKLMDLSGRIFINKIYNVLAGDNEYALNELDKLNAGIYIVIISQGNESISYKVIKAH